MLDNLSLIKYCLAFGEKMSLTQTSNPKPKYTMITNLISVVILVLIFSSNAFALTNITSLPFNCTISGETYVIASDLSLSSGDAIAVSADNVVINGNGKTITYAVTGQGRAILVDTTVTSIEIYNLTLTQGSYDPLSGERVHAIYSNGNISGVNIHNNTINVNHSGTVSNAYGYGIGLLNIANASINNNIYSNTINVTGTSAGRGIAVDVTNPGSFSGSIYSNTILLSNITSQPAGYPTGIYLGNGANGSVSVYSNTVTIDVGSSIAQGIQIWASHNCTVRNNTVNVAGRNSRAILIDGASNNNEVYLNAVTMTSQNLSSENTAGIRVRFGSSSNEIYRNTIDGSEGINCYPIRYGGTDSNGTPQNNVFHHNILKSNSRVISIEEGSMNTNFYSDSITNIGSGSAIFFYGTNAVSPYSPGYPSNVFFSYESISGPKNIILTGATGETGSQGIVFCQSGVTVSDVTVGLGTQDWTITSANCSSEPPARPANTRFK